MVKELRGKKSCDIGLMPSILCVVCSVSGNEICGSSLWPMFAK